MNNDLEQYPKKPSFEEWLSSRTETIEVDCGCVTTEAFYHWLKVAYEATPQPAHAEQATTEWNNNQCLEFLQVAFSHNTIDGEIEFDDIRLGVKFALAAAPKPESE